MRRAGVGTAPPKWSMLYRGAPYNSAEDYMGHTDRDALIRLDEVKAAAQWQ
jgi:hypothetical protein